MKLLLSFIFLILSTTSAYAQLSPEHKKNVLPQSLSSHPLIVVHASTQFDDQKTAKDGIDAVTKKFKSSSQDVIYLINDQSPKGYKAWYPADPKPTYEIYSEGGEHNLPLNMNEVTIIGGYFGSSDGSRGCQTLAVRDAIRMHFEVSKNPIKIHMPVEAEYFYDVDTGIRKKLINLKMNEATPDQLSQIFNDFADLFFIVDNFAPSKAFAHIYGGNHPGYREGTDEMEIKNYHFEILFNGQKVAEFGTGKKQVYLSLENKFYTN